MFEEERDNRPLYTQLVERISLSVLAGRLPPGDKLPSVRELAADYRVNPNTLQRALGELEQQGLIFTVSTSGKFVTRETGQIEALRREYARRELQRCRQRMAALGYSAEQTAAMMKEEADESDTGM